MISNEELTDAIDSGVRFALANLHTNVVCKVTAVNEKTISVKPVNNRIVNGESVELPEFTEVPPVFMCGGESYEAFPIAVGDDCILVISERCFDAWYDGNNYVSPVDMRMHDYSDGFALVGIRNKLGSIVIPDVITKIGDMFAQGNWEHEGNLIRRGDENITGDATREGNETVTGDRGQTGNIAVTGEISATVKISAPVIVAGNGFSGTKVADGVSFVFENGILIS